MMIEPLQFYISKMLPINFNQKLYFTIEANEIQKELITGFTDLDFSVLLLTEDYKLISEKYLVFYNNLSSINEAVRILTPDIVMKGNPPYYDYELILIDFEKLPKDIKKIVFCCSIYQNETTINNFEFIIQIYYSDLLGKQKDNPVANFKLIPYKIGAACNLFELIYDIDHSKWELMTEQKSYEGGFAEVLDNYMN